ncbi:hypothetical protein SteCoe_9803 [Stentor coeruleus]|uniref:Uncharacterized protein n=1 Tax=Stentor coeruleus TaxID=5963 RepID=A0A1R2CH09_9CILI|nr:hypothetical protein SteCoe_9803 [Stentor coeruleus]
MRIDSKILALVLLFIGILFLSDTLLFSIYGSPESIIDIEGENDYFDINLNDSCFSEKAFSRPIFMSTRLINITYQPISYGMNEIESDNLLKITNPITCPRFNVINFQNFSSNCKLSKGKNIHIFEYNFSIPENYGSTLVKYKLSEHSENYIFSSNSEFGYVECDEKHKDIFLRNVFNQTVADNARKIEEKLKKKYSVGSNYRPLTVMMFILDSVSRRSFYRNMKETVNFFNNTLVSNSSELSKKFVLYDFLGNNAVKDLTRPNMAPLIYGISIDTIIEQEGDRSIDSDEDKNFYLERQKAGSIWYYYKKKGFVTMHLNDVITDYLSKISGRELLVDHQVSNFWTLSNQYFGYNDIIKEYKCIGPEYSHKHSLNYLSQFLKNYEGYNKFSYTHLTIAHDFSGTRLSLGDKDFKKFLKETLESYSKINEDLFIVFAGDHGRYKFEFSSLYGKGERSLPFHFVISNKEFIDGHEFHKNLDVNSRRLLSRYDWYKTLKHLANMPYTNIGIQSQEYKEIKTENKSLSVLIERARKDRKCSDIGIDPNNCISSPFKEVTNYDISKDNHYSYFLNKTLENMETFYKKKLDSKCNIIKLDNVLYIGKREFTSDNDVKPISIIEVFTVKNSKGKFLIQSSISNKSSFSNLMKTFLEFEFFESVKIKGRKKGKNAVFSLKRIWSLTRLDIVNPDFIVFNKTCCQDSTYYNYNYLYSLENLSCLQVCEKNNLQCTDYRFLNLFIKFNENLFTNVNIVGELNSLELVNSTLFVGRYDMCANDIVSDSAICHCAQYK